MIVRRKPEQTYVFRIISAVKLNFYSMTQDLKNPSVTLLVLNLLFIQQRLIKTTEIAISKNLQ